MKVPVDGKDIALLIVFILVWLKPTYIILKGILKMTMASYHNFWNTEAREQSRTMRNDNRFHAMLREIYSMNVNRGAGVISDLTVDSIHSGQYRIDLEFERGHRYGFFSDDDEIIQRFIRMQDNLREERRRNERVARFRRPGHNPMMDDLREELDRMSSSIRESHIFGSPLSVHTQHFAITFAVERLRAGDRVTLEAWMPSQFLEVQDNKIVNEYGELHRFTIDELDNHTWRIWNETDDLRD